MNPTKPPPIYSLRGLRVTLDTPVLVARSKGYLWFPTLARMNNGILRATMSDYADDHLENSTSNTTWSNDSGRTWGPTVKARYCDVEVRLPGGDAVLLPYYLYPLKESPLTIGAPFNFAPHDSQTLRAVEPGVSVSGFPRRDIRLKNGAAGFVFNGQAVAVEGGYLATLYGTFEGTNRYSLLAAFSADALNWTIRAVVSDENCPLQGTEGPCEAALCRLRNGRLMCIYRMASNVPFGQQFSGDDGKTWAPPRAMANAFSVQPSLAVMKDGLLALSGGRPGIYLWFNPAGDGVNWVRLNLEEHHNASIEDEPIALPGWSSSYTEVVALDERSLMVIYDRIPHSWAAIPPESKDTNSVWVVRATIQRA